MAIDAERLRQECIYSAKATAAQIASDFADIERAVQGWRLVRSRFLKLGGLVLAGAIISFIAGAATDTPALVAVGVLALIGSVALFIYGARYGRGILKHAGRIETAKSLATMLSHDSHPSAQISMQLALNARRRMLSEAPWPDRKKGKQKFFSDTWLEAEAELLDGSTICEHVSDLIRERSFVNPRGKSKTKTRVRHLVAMRLIYPNKTYGDVRASGAKLRNDLRVPASARVRSVQISDHDVKMKTLVDSSGDLPQTISMVALGGYRMLNLARRTMLSKGGAH
jgi:hypothetical protein